MKNEDHTTRTVDGAAGYDRYHAEPIDDRPTLSELQQEEEYDEEYEPECNCSDPGCPCGGRKAGGL